MSIDYYHGLCNRYKGRAVRIRTRDGREHRGIIDRVDRRHVYLRPVDGGRRLGGFGYGFGGGYGGYGWYGGGYRVALGVIAGVSLLSLFFW